VTNKGDDRKKNFLFFILAELYSELNNTTQIIKRTKGVVILQPKCRRKGCTTIDIVFYFSFLFPRVRICRESTVKGFLYAIALLYTCGVQQ
jgi:hypothetical protein